MDTSGGGKMDIDMDRPTAALERLNIRSNRRRTDARSDTGLVVVCNASAQLSCISAGSLFSHLLKHFLYIRALLPAPFDSIALEQDIPAQVRLCMPLLDEVLPAVLRSNLAVNQS